MLDAPNLGETDPACPHGIKPPVVCPQCDPETYERARPQVERYLRKRVKEGKSLRSL